MIERMIRRLNEHYAHPHRFVVLQHALRVIRDWTAFYNLRLPLVALGMKAPIASYASTA
ncbi:MAG: integrase core domain-containing protein [Xanthomonadaceae bacterium]|nr:integrase core domain-containing protein [Xanthomonadaceae bacterium]